MHVQHLLILMQRQSEPNARMIDSINELAWVAGHDLDGFVRRPAEDSLNIIREWIKEWAEKPQKIDVKMREKEEKKEDMKQWQ